MAIIKAVSSRAPIGTILDYVTRKEKVLDKLVSGVGCAPDTVKEEMQSTKELYGKSGGRTYKHFVQSFAPGEEISSAQAHEIAVDLASNSKMLQGYEVLIATHQDKNHIHSHFIVNSVSFENGRKFQMSSKDLQHLKDQSDELCKQRGLSVCAKGRDFAGEERQSIVAWTKEKYQYLKALFEEDNAKSYMCNIKTAIERTLEEATSIEGYKNRLAKQGITVKWEESRKHITYIDSEGRKVRDTNLKKTFNLSADKETLLRSFERNNDIKGSPSLLEEKLLVAKYKLKTEIETHAVISQKIQEERGLVDVLKNKFHMAQTSLDNLQEDIHNWTKEKKECSSILFGKKFELQGKIDHAQTLIESIRVDRDEFMSRYDIQSYEDIKSRDMELSRIEHIGDKLDESIRNGRTSIKDFMQEYRNTSDDLETLFSDKGAIDSAREELQKMYGSEFSEERLQRIATELREETRIELTQGLSVEKTI